MRVVASGSGCGQRRPTADSGRAACGGRFSALFDIDEGRNLNSFLRDGPVAAHLLLRSGTEPRILVAFPAGNSGVGLWFAKTRAAGDVDAGDAAAADQTRSTTRHRPLHGIEFEVETDARELRPRARGAVVDPCAARLRVAAQGAGGSAGGAARRRARASPGRAIGSTAPRATD